MYLPLTIIIIDIILLIILYKVYPTKQEAKRNTKIILILGIITYFSFGYLYNGTITFSGQDHIGMEGDMQLGSIAISAFPGLLISTIISSIERIKYIMYEKRK